jgi:hypothetical protein
LRLAQLIKNYLSHNSQLVQHVEMLSGHILDIINKLDFFYIRKKISSLWILNPE